jgi:radical SAM protein with 4Fe4S-binding SPASM domain
MKGGRLLSEITRTAYENKIPFAVNLELTHQCNENCRHCYIDFNAPPPLPAKYWKRFLDELLQLGTLLLTISGGEPLLHPEFEDIYRYAHSNGFAIRLFSNLLKLDTSILSLLEKHKPLNVQTSIYGHTAELHDDITRLKGSFVKTTGAVRRLLEIGIPVIMKTTWMQPNIASMQEIEKFVYDLGADFQGSVRIMPARNGKSQNTNLRLSMEQLVSLYADDTSTPKAWTHKSDALLPDGNRVIDDAEFTANTLDYPCGAAVITMRIAPDGRVFPCVQFSKAGGNAVERSLREIWETSSWFATLRSLRQSNAKECSQCSLAKHCFRCPADSYEESGDPLGCSSEAKIIVQSYIKAMDNVSR